MRTCLEQDWVCWRWSLAAFGRGTGFGYWVCCCWQWWLHLTVSGLVLNKPWWCFRCLSLLDASFLTSLVWKCFSHSVHLMKMTDLQISVHPAASCVFTPAVTFPPHLYTRDAECKERRAVLMWRLVNWKIRHFQGHTVSHKVVFSCEAVLQPDSSNQGDNSRPAHTSLSWQLDRLITHTHMRNHSGNGVMTTPPGLLPRPACVCHPRLQREGVSGCFCVC